jgi:hypothetical protein
MFPVTKILMGLGLLKVRNYQSHISLAYRPITFNSFLVSIEHDNTLFLWDYYAEEHPECIPHHH